MQRITGTMRVQLAHDVKSADGKRVYREGEFVYIAVQAMSDVRVWDGDRAPVVATFKEICGSRLTDTNE